jgi:hypothetical protein
MLDAARFLSPPPPMQVNGHMSFEDLVNQHRTQRSADRSSEPAANDSAAETGVADFAAVLSQTGLAATMTLASYGVRPIPVGHLKTRFGYEYPEQTSHAWRFPGHLYLLRDGTWWQAQNVTAAAQSAPPPAIRWAMSDDPQAPGTILCPQRELTAEILTRSDPDADDAPAHFATTTPDGQPDGLQLWNVAGVTVICDGNDSSQAAPFEEWAAAAVAALIDAR